MSLRRLMALILLALALTGCWSRRELTEVSFTGLLGVDWEDGRYLVTVTVLSPRPGGGTDGGGGGRQQAVWTISERGEALDQAFARLDQILSRSLTLAHVRAIIFGENMARHGIGPAMDVMLRSVEIRPTAWIAVTPGRASDLLMARPRQELAPSDSPLGYHETATRRSSVTPARRLTEVANMLQEEGVDLSLPIFRLAETESPRPEGALNPHPESPKEITYGGAGVFVGDKLVNWLSPAEARGLLWSKNRAVHGAVSAPCRDPKQRVVFRLRDAHGRVSTYMSGGKPRGQINVKVLADVNEIGCTGEALGDAESQTLQRLLEAEVSSQIRSALTQMRSSKSDFFGFGQALFRHSPQLYSQRSRSWAELLAELPVEVHVTAQVPRLGQLYRTYRASTKGSE